MDQPGSSYDPIGWGYTPPQAGGVYGGLGGSTSSGSSTSTSSGQTSTQMIPGMQADYQQLLGINQGRYQNMMSAYNQGQNNINQQMPGITQGYNTLGGQIQNTLGMGGVLGQNGNWGVAAPAEQQIQQTMQQQQAQNTQNMANAGLGNTSVGANLSNQAALQASQATAGLGAQLAQTAAGYQAQIGQSQLGAQMQGLGMATGLTQGALNPMTTQAANTAGTLTGGFGSSQGSSQSRQSGQSVGGSGQGGGQGGGSPSSGAGSPTGPQGSVSPTGGVISGNPSSYVPPDGGGGTGSTGVYNFGGGGGTGTGSTGVYNFGAGGAGTDYQGVQSQIDPTTGQPALNPDGSGVQGIQSQIDPNTGQPAANPVQMVTQDQVPDNYKMVQPGTAGAIGVKNDFSPGGIEYWAPK